jgi:N-acetylglucosaminylphosphatidylinositol deacetylase
MDGLVVRNFPDSMNITWSAEKIATVLHETFTSSSDSRDLTTDTLITFDSQGISSHPNHISLYHGAKAFVSSLTPNDPNPDDPKERIIPVDLYTLTTVSFLRKYSGPFDVLLVKLVVNRLAVLGGDGSLGTRSEQETEAGHPARLAFIIHGLGIRGWATAKEAMTAAHVSQMKWFRYGWIILSRYMYVNDLVLDGL